MKTITISIEADEELYYDVVRAIPELLERLSISHYCVGGNANNEADEKARAIFKRAIEMYGERSQVDMMLEEMSELANALLKLRRNRGGIDPVLEEMADVEIMLEQMGIIYGDSSRWREYKIRRLKERLDSNG